MVNFSGLALATALSLTLPGIAPRAALAQAPSAPAATGGCVATTVPEQLALNAAKNEARQLAEVTNGGLGLYRAEPAMYGAVVSAPCEVVSPGLYRFSFRGGEPVAVNARGEYSLLTVVLVDSTAGSGRQLTLEYNGPLSDGPTSATSATTALDPTAPAPVTPTPTPPAPLPPVASEPIAPAPVTTVPVTPEAAPELTAAGTSEQASADSDTPAEAAAIPDLGMPEATSPVAPAAIPAPMTPAPATPTAAANPMATGGCVATTPQEQVAMNAAKNEARQRAEQENGGIGLYRAEPAMYGLVLNSPCEVVQPGVWRFIFRGGDPAAVSTRGEYRLLSVVTVTGEGAERTVTLDYNGPIAEYPGAR